MGLSLIDGENCHNNLLILTDDKSSSQSTKFGSTGSPSPDHDHVGDINMDNNIQKSDNDNTQSSIKSPFRFNQVQFPSFSG